MSVAMKNTCVTLALLRDHFPIFQDKVYLNSCSYGAISLEVEAALNAYITLRKTIGADWGLWARKMGRLRQLLANVLGGAAEDISISSSLSESVNSIASALDFTGRRNEVIVTDFDFPTTAQIWHHKRYAAQQLRAFQRRRTGRNCCLNPSKTSSTIAHCWFQSRGFAIGMARA